MSISALAHAEPYSVTDLGSLGGAYSLTQAIGLNDLGQVTGYGYSGGFDGSSFSDTYRAFVTDANGANIRALGTLGGTWSQGRAVDDTGRVYGYSTNAAGDSLAFTVDAKGGALVPFAGPLPGEGSHQYPAVDFSNVATYAQGNAGAFGQYGPASTSTNFGSNASGQVVGQFTNTNTFGLYGFVTGPQGTGPRDVDTLEFSNFAIPAHPDNASFFESATAINSIGQFVANADNGHAYLLSPVPEPTTIALMLAGLGVVGMAGRRRAPKLFAMS